MLLPSYLLSYNIPLVLQPCACFEDFTFFSNYVNCFCLHLVVVLIRLGQTITSSSNEAIISILKIFMKTYLCLLIEDFDMFDVIVNAVKAIKNRSKYTFISSDSKVKLNIKFPCGICYKNVNKNQKAIFCMTC